MVDKVGNDVYIGYGVTVIGLRRIVNSAFVTKDVPNYVIVGDVPKKVICYRFPVEQITFLNKLQ